MQNCISLHYVLIKRGTDLRYRISISVIFIKIGNSDLASGRNHVVMISSQCKSKSLIRPP